MCVWGGGVCRCGCVALSTGHWLMLFVFTHQVDPNLRFVPLERVCTRVFVVLDILFLFLFVSLPLCVCVCVCVCVCMWPVYTPPRLCHPRLDGVCVSGWLHLSPSLAPCRDQEAHGRCFRRAGVGRRASIRLHGVRAPPRAHTETDLGPPVTDRQLQSRGAACSAVPNMIHHCRRHENCAACSTFQSPPPWLGSSMDLQCRDDSPKMIGEHCRPLLLCYRKAPSLMTFSLVCMV